MKSAKTFTEMELKTLLQIARRRASRGSVVDKTDHALLIFAYATGCRVSEIASASLHRQDPNFLDLDAGVLTITQAKHGSTGQVPLDVASLRTIRYYCREIRPRFKNADRLDRVFLSKVGRPYSANVLSQKFSLMLKRLGFEGFSAHAFRHYFATDLCRRGVAIHVTQSLLRHRDARTTIGIYSHATSDDQANAVNRRVG